MLSLQIPVHALDSSRQPTALSHPLSGHKYPLHPNAYSGHMSEPSHLDSNLNVYDAFAFHPPNPRPAIPDLYPRGYAHHSDDLASPSSAVPYSPASDNPYGPSPPGTATSTSSVPPLSAGPGLQSSPSRHLHRSLSTPHLSGDSGDRKTYSFVALPGNSLKKRPRRRYDEIERLYQCSWPDCNKSYGTLNHLNAHVTMQKHGSKRSPNEFKELRKQWRKAKKEQEAAFALRCDPYEDVYEDASQFGHRYNNVSHSLHRTAVAAPSVAIGTADRYLALDHMRYPPPQERDDPQMPIQNHGLYEQPQLTARQRYSSGLLPATWHPSSSLSRSNLHHHQHQHQQEELYTPSHMSHHSQLPQLSIATNLSRPSTPPSNSAPIAGLPHSIHPPPSLRGLPQNSTLLTPLPGYHGSTIIPPLQPDPTVYHSQETAYELYDDHDPGSRPGTAHTNLSVGYGSGEDYER